MSGAKDFQLIELKDTITQLNIMIKSQCEMIQSLQQTLEELKEQLLTKDQDNSNLKAQVKFLSDKLYGTSSEKTPDMIGQLSLFDTIPCPEENPNDDNSDGNTPDPVVPTQKRNRRSKLSYDEMFANLKTEQVYVNTLTEEEKLCPVCNTEMLPIGHEVIRTAIIYKKAELIRVEYIGTTYECPKCKVDEAESQFIKDNGKPALIPGSYVSESLVTKVMYDKYVNALPLCRQEKDFEMMGAKITRAAMANWVITCSENYLNPMFEYMRRKLLERQFLMADETPLQVLKEPDKRPESKSYVWLVRTGEDNEIPIILYKYEPSRSGDCIASLLDGHHPDLYLMVDGYSGYNKLKGINKCCCYAHIRRYFFEAIPKGHEQDFTDPAVQAVLYCNKLFDYESSYKERGLSLNQIYKRRLKDEKPIVEAFLCWAEKQTPVKGSRFDKAINYLLNRRDSLMTYLENPRCSLSNNQSERSIRPVTIGRKNYLFSDTQAGADASMLVYSIVETAKANGLHPGDYINYLLEQRPSADMSDDELEVLAPWSEEVKIALQNKDQ